MDLSHLKILGTSHISPESIKQVERIVTEWKPNIICVELDKGRLIALLQGSRKITISDIGKVGMKGYILAKIGGWGSKKLGKVVGTTPGDEMKKAVELAKREKLKLFLIDQNVQVTLKKFSKAFSWKERFTFLWDIISSPFKKQNIPFDLHSAPNAKVVEELTQQVLKRYPTMYKVLVEERNRVMARNIARIMKKYPDEKIFVVVGAGHVKGMKDLLQWSFE